MSNISSKQKIIIANWKMKLGFRESLSLARKIRQRFKNFSGNVVICPDFVSLYSCGQEIKKSNLKLGAQDAFWQDSGAYTGEISPQTLKTAGCRYVILGHSERRKYLKEDYNLINLKLKKVLAVSALTPVICIGENQKERSQGLVKSVLTRQLQEGLKGVALKADQKVIIAYEPLWAIGSGKVIKNKDLEEISGIIKQFLKKSRSGRGRDKFSIIYGGSVDSKNIKGISQIEGIDGCLVGGASLK